MKLKLIKQFKWNQLLKIVLTQHNNILLEQRSWLTQEDTPSIMWKYISSKFKGRLSHELIQPQTERKFE